MNFREHHSASVFLLGALERATAGLPLEMGQRLSAALATEPGAQRASASRVHAAWSLAEELLGPDVGLVCARELQLAELDPHGFGRNAAGTVQEALQLAARYHALLHSGLAVSVEHHAGTVALRLRPLRPPDHAGDSGVPPALLEFVMATTSRLARHLFPELQLGEVRLRRASQGRSQLPGAALGCPPRTTDGEAALLFPAADLALRNRLADGVVGGILAAHLERELRALESPAPFGAAVRGLLLRQLSAGTSAVDVARTLGMSDRTLRRRLDAEGTGHRQLLEDARRALAIGLLGRDGLSVDEVAYHLGYAQPSSFQRAFKRWTSLPPATFRTRCMRAG